MLCKLSFELAGIEIDLRTICMVVRGQGILIKALKQRYHKTDFLIAQLKAPRTMFSLQFIVKLFDRRGFYSQPQHTLMPFVCIRTHYNP